MHPIKLQQVVVDMLYFLAQRMRGLLPEIRQQPPANASGGWVSLQFP
ncbi:MAG: hypothetical protein IPF96_20715 [Rhodobacter sp.]|nr:hypothetical protein [Rhodobacter sp.]